MHWPAYHSRRSEDVVRQCQLPAAMIQGFLTSCGDDSAAFALTVWVPVEFPDRVAWHIDMNPNSSQDPETKLLLTYRSSPSEDFYGLGAQASFASLKNQSVLIFSREQGVGRRDQPTTRLENESSFFAGGDHFTIYFIPLEGVSPDRGEHCLHKLRLP